jgi:hypothetical protein
MLFFLSFNLFHPVSAYAFSDLSKYSLVFNDNTDEVST